MLINHSLPGQMESLEKHPVTYLAVKEVCVRKGTPQLNFASNLKEFISCQILLKEITGLELNSRTGVRVGFVRSILCKFLQKKI